MPPAVQRQFDTQRQPHRGEAADGRAPGSVQPREPETRGIAGGNPRGGSVVQATLPPPFFGGIRCRPQAMPANPQFQSPAAGTIPLVRPVVDERQAAVLALRFFGLEADAVELGSNQDRNFLLTSARRADATS